MKRPHDMGGEQAGPIPDKDDSILFHQNWQAKALALNLACGALGAWNIDASRFAREQLRDYASLSYYEKWMAGLTDLLVKRGMVGEAELTGPIPQAALSAKALRAADVLTAMQKVVPYQRADGPAAHFETGDHVRTLTAPRPNHCRMPAYVAGCEGVVALCHGNHVLPDCNALFEGEAPEPLYTVTFSATTLWGSAAESPKDSMSVDLWQSYLVPA